jgi:hypothetical protein
LVFGCASVILISACGARDEADRAARLEERLAALEERVARSMQEWETMRQTMELGACVIDSAPSLPDPAGVFLGGGGISFGGEFDWQSSKVLAEGVATVSGRVRANGVGRAGVKFRLFLSGIRTAWAVSDTDGLYRIRVPPGRYRYQGYELDLKSANSALAGMIQRERGPGTFSDDAIDAPAGGSTAGPDFEFATAIITVSPAGGAILPKRGVRLEWRPCSGAVQYEIGLNEGQRTGRGSSWRSLTSYPNPLRTSDTFLVIPDRIALDPAKTYSWSVTAFDARGMEISHSPDRHDAGFRVE